MPLSPPAPRRHYHTRRIECHGYHRDDGLWDIEGHMTDVKSYSFENAHRGEVEAGTPVHEMWLRLTLDDGFEIKAAEASTEHGPYDACPAIAPAYAKLVGVRIGPGFRKAVRDRVGGTAGCTHLTELLYPMATVAFQTIVGSGERARRDAGLAPKDRSPGAADGASRAKPGLIDTCHAYRADGPVVRREWPDFFKGAEARRAETNRG
ncbi:DUF2889 domain-containing protein [Marivibrio halodurans]|uniref:DUF2889 domain-containing protein n=1 Tax=Marivibrio halodurans TaxID=2039722 RepID=A0A8J7S2B8_9PROT|nr:DUF2889 domain-containing protein [Marivibrio halodurans]MBP5859067.1 DUF2889 domain-containing protein [Marivibrio halodurans]